MDTAGGMIGRGSEESGKGKEKEREDEEEEMMEVEQKIEMQVETPRRGGLENESQSQVETPRRGGQEKRRKRGNMRNRTRLTLASHERPQVTTPRRPVRVQPVHVMLSRSPQRKPRRTELSDEEEGKEEMKKWEAAKVVLDRSMLRVAEIAMKCTEANWEPTEKVRINSRFLRGKITREDGS